MHIVQRWLRPIVADVFMVCVCVCLGLYRSTKAVNCAKTAEPISDAICAVDNNLPRGHFPAHCVAQGISGVCQA